MGQTYSIDLIDKHAQRMNLGSVATASVKCQKKSKTPLKVRGELYCTPDDKKIYLQTASTHGDTMHLSISNDTKTILGKFRLTFFDPHSHQAIFNAIGDVEVIPGP